VKVSKVVTHPVVGEIVNNAGIYRHFFNQHISQSFCGLVAVHPDPGLQADFG
jgi:hypothetical protein